ncbi:terminase family protein [uncultured Desulfovibrio sp.]|uniref:terminase large subunit domain-containing protein n=1 Tax=uncultured Desulfovibrio sp. TaxID=167968 RepID=UPI002612415E|nr:terminase family protein [uncultured Desulfovibrio sp.]
MDRICRLTGPQWQVYSDSHRFRVLVSGRRFGKTRMSIEELLRAAVQAPGRKVWYVAPTYRQAQQICWQMLKDRLAGGNWIARKNESDLSIMLRGGGSVISLRGADNFDSLRGVGLHFLVMDEFADIKPEAWFEVLRATLSDTGGKALFTGTPKGRNWAYDLFQRGGHPDYPEWASYSFTTIEGGNVPAAEVELARRELDELTFRQEYEASFVNFEGRVYYPFTVETHAASLRQFYNPRALLAFCFDFNVEPGVAAVCQEVKLPNGLEGTAVIGEVYIPRNSNTPAVCRRLIQDWGGHEGAIICYGDATGGSRGSAKVAGSDWDLIKAEFRQSPLGSKISYDVPSANPPERARVNAVNSRLKSETGDIRLMVDQQYAPHVVKDLEGVVLLKGGSGEIDKKATPELSHISDALGYYVIRRFPTTRVETRTFTISASRSEYYV